MDKHDQTIVDIRLTKLVALKKALKAKKARERQALAFLKGLVREMKGYVEREEEIPGADAVDYLVALYQRAKEIVNIKERTVKR